MASPSTILLVDDEPDITQTLSYRLEAAGYSVVTAGNGEEALEVMRRQDVDLVLADFMMPEMNGIELTRNIKAHPKWFATKVLLFSCNGDPEFRERALKLGALDYMPKALGANRILDRVYDQVRPQKAFDDESDIVPAAPPAPPAPLPETSVKQQVAALARSLNDMLHLARATGDLPESTSFALDSAQRLTAEMLELVQSRSKDHVRS
ncbi:MAG: response regulator [Acidobacteria bacterium]|nr:response regulator [Acidobacteriota bacterium]